MKDNVTLFNPNEDLSQKEKLAVFAQQYATNGGDHVQAYIEAGFSAKTAKQNALKYLNKHHEHVMAVVKRVMTQNSAKMQNVLMSMIDSENTTDANKLKAIDMMLKNSGIQKDTLVIEENNVNEMSPEQRQREIQEIMSKMKKEA